ncbi:MAG: hypothetical protein NC243_05575 [Lachnoclostridium sp.]|nr:hypothetical protein [Lachnoclostridium sp.]
MGIRMIKINLNDDELQVMGTFDFGYIGKFKDDEISIVDTIDEIRDWELVCDNLSEDCSDEEIVELITEYFNNFEKKIQDNIKNVNGDFLLHVMSDMYHVANEFWTVKELVTDESMICEGIDPYKAHASEFAELSDKYMDTPNNGSIDKSGIEAKLREYFPLFHFDTFLENVIPESVGLSDGFISFQCSDGFGNKILCGAYDELDEELRFTDWHNF